MPQEFTTSVTTNTLVVLESLADAERKTGRYLTEDISAFCLDKRFNVCRSEIQSSAGFRRAIKNLEVDAHEKGLRPILHLEVHGLGDKSGLLFHPSGDTMKWDELGDLTRELNRATKNNLLVVMAVCHGYSAILATDIKKLTPFCILIGPEGEITNQELLRGCGPFYRGLLEDGSLTDAVMHLPASYGLHSCERLFANLFAKHVRENCRGSGRQERVESLVTQARAVNTTMSLRNLRRAAKKRARPDPATFEKFGQRFLMSAHPENRGRFSVTFQDVLGFEEAQLLAR
jgi:hypothetical protein